MNSFQRFVTGRSFAFLSVFMIFFCLFAVVILDAKHPLYIFALVCGVVVFALQQYRKILIRRNPES